MNTVVGIDLGRKWATVVRLLKRLDIEGLNQIFVNAIESVLPDGSFIDLPTDHPISQIVAESRAEGMKQCEEAQAMLGGMGECTARPGVPKEVLFHIMEERKAELVALGTEKKSALGDLFFGSVSKALLTGSKCSVLFGKNEVPESGPLTAVFATDHSDYANRAAEWLLRSGIRGISKLVVLTAATINPLVGRDIVQHVVNMGDPILKSIMGEIRESNEALAARFTEAGIPAAAEVRETHPSIAIEDAMKEHGADLLIVGAQGRGFLERLRVGSTSFEQVVNRPYNVLVVRP